MTEAIKWQRGQSDDDDEYYFCKHGEFTLTLLTDQQSNSTRVGVYFKGSRIYILDKESTKKEATAELQEYLSELSLELQTLSRIEF